MLFSSHSFFEAKGIHYFQFPDKLVLWLGGEGKDADAFLFALNVLESHLICIEKNSVLGTFYFEEAWKRKRI